MKIFKTYGLQIISVIIFLVIGLCMLLKEHASNMYYEEACEPLRANWVVDMGTKTKHFDVLPEYVITNGENEVLLRRNLGVVENFDAVGFFTFQQQVYVYLDDKEIMRFVPEEGVNSKTPGNGWKIIEFTEEDSGKDLSIRIVQCYDNNKVMLPVIYYGTSSGISLSYLKREMPMFLLSMVEVVVGFLVLILCAVSGKNLKLSVGLPWLSFFAIFIGIWSGIETNIYSLFIDNLLFFSWLSYMCLKMAVAPYIIFVNVTFYKGKSKFLKALTLLSMAEFWVTSILQFTGIVDYAYTVFVTHLILLTAAVYVIVSAFRKLVFYRQNNDALVEKRRTYMAHSMLTIVVTCFCLFDLYGYYFTNSPDIAQFSRIGYWSYIVTVTMASLLDYMYLVSMGQQAAVIKEEASIDIMTKLRNRASFENDIDKLNRKNSRKMGIVVFDLNNLKFFNDVHGHNIGDYYIIASSEVIQDSFGKWGRIYRIGGDEFCGIVMGLTVEEFECIRKEMEVRISAIHIPNFELHMEIASGFAIFDDENDTSLRDTMKRADANMYERKMQLKEKSRISVR